MNKIMQLGKLSLAIGICFFPLIPSIAQPGVSPYYKAPASFAGKTFVVPAGTTFEGRIETTIGSTVSKQGSPFTISITSPIFTNASDVLIPAGAIVIGEVVQAIPAKDVPHVKKVKSVGKLRVQINALKMPDGMTYPMIASLVGEEAIANNPYQANNIINPVRGSGISYVSTPTGFESVAPGRAHYNPRTGASQVVTKNEMLNDPIMGRERGMNGDKTAMRSLVKKKHNLFIYNGSPLTIRLEAPLKLGIGSSAGEESALGLRSSESQRSENLQRAGNNNAPANSQYQNTYPPSAASRQNGFMPRTQQKNSNQDSNF